MWRARAREEGSSPSPGGSGSSGGDPLGILVDIAVGELEHLVSTHPNAGRRACLLEQKAYDLFSEKPRDAVYVGRENLRRRQPMADRVF